MGKVVVCTLSSLGSTFDIAFFGQFFSSVTPSCVFTYVQVVSLHEAANIDLQANARTRTLSLLEENQARKDPKQSQVDRALQVYSTVKSSCHEHLWTADAQR